MVAPVSPEVRIDWLCGPAAPPLVLTDWTVARVVRDTLADHAGKTSFEITTCNLGFGVFRINIDLTQCDPDEPIPNTNISVDMPEPTLRLATLRGAPKVFYDNVTENKLTINDGVTLLQYTKRFDYDVILDPSGLCETVSIWITESGLLKVFGECVAKKLKNVLGIEQSPVAKSIQLSKPLSHALFSCAPQEMTEDMQKLHAQARMMDFFRLMAKYVVDEYDNANRVSSQNGAKIRKLREELDCLQGEPPTLNELSARYGLCSRTLNEGFKEMYGSTINAFVNERRLNAARSALLETDIPMKVLAAQIGYSHVNNFINAFRNKFGYSPGSLRRSNVF